MSRVESANKKILDEGLASDVIISAGENGLEIPSHKCFLIANSPVLRRMLECKLEESKSGRISMADISEEGVKAFLRFIYHGEVIKPEESIDLAHHVLYAAHKYEVCDLEAIMNTHLLERKDEDFGASLALKIYCFVRGIESAHELKTKLVRIMRMNYSEVKELPEFKEVFRKNPDDAIELCNNLVEVKMKVNKPASKRRLHPNESESAEEIRRKLRKKFEMFKRQQEQLVLRAARIGNNN